MPRWSEQVTRPRSAFVWEGTSKDKDAKAGKMGATAPHYRDDVFLLPTRILRAAVLTHFILKSISVSQSE